MKVWDPEEDKEPETLANAERMTWLDWCMVGVGILLAIWLFGKILPSKAEAHSWYEPVCPESSKMVDCKAERCVNISPLLTTPNVGGSSMGTPIAIQFSEKRKWGRLTPIKHVRDEFTSGGKRQPVWLFSCECGNECDVRAYAVICGSTQSCGCLAEETRGQATITHGASSGGMTPEYKTWRNMLTRGRNPNISHADRYVKRGITVADEWLPGGDGKGFERFLDHIGRKPSKKHSLDRIDNDKGYEPGNVRWATQKTQSLNRSDNRLIPYKGEMIPMAEAARRSGVRYGVLRDRVFKLGWPEERWFEPRARAEFGMGKHSRKGVKPRRSA